MGLNAAAAAAAVLAEMDSDGVFNVVADETERAAVRASTAAGLERHLRGLITYLTENITIVVQAGAIVVDSEGTVIGETRDDVPCAVS